MAQNEYLVDGADMTTVADAIRERGGTTAPLSFPDGMANAVREIQSGGAVSSVNGKTGDVTLTAGDVGAISQDDLANVQSTIAAKMDNYTIKTVMDSVATQHTQYYLGNQTAVDIVLPDSADVGQIITVCWYNGETAATLSITGTMLSFDYTPSANTRSEINALWDGTYWAVLGNEMAVPSEVTA